jgi:hypothetical protein
MNKQTKMLIGVGVVAVAGYVYWKSTQKKSFANLTAPNCLGNPDQEACSCSYNTPSGCKKEVGTANDGTTLCANGHTCCKKKIGPCPPKGSQAGS